MTPKQIGAVMRKARGERSKRSVAAAAGIHRDQLTAIEEGKTDYTNKTLVALCKALGVRMELVRP
jgi:transcriptional regulator with XRE-family HTH domain